MRISFGSLARRVSGWTLFAALLLPLPSFAVPSITVNTINGTLTTVDANNNECTYESLMEDASGNWTVSCGPGTKKFRFSTPPLSGGSCTSFSTLTEDASGNWTATGCQSPCVPTVTLTAFSGTSIPVGAAYGLTATASANCGRTITKVDYKVDSVLISGPSGVITAPYTWNWTPATDKVYSVVAIATDSGGGTTTSSERTIRANAGPTGVTINASPPGPRAAPATFTLTATASDSDGIASVEYRTVAGTSLGSSTQGPAYTFNWTNVTSGTYPVFARAIDTLGRSTDSAPTTVTVSASNTPPAVSITSPAPGQVFATGTIPLTANASDSDGVVVSVVYLDGDTLSPVGSAPTGANYSATWTGVAAGARKVVARATDNSGAVTLSAVVNFTVLQNTAPVMSYAPLGTSTFSAAVGGPISLRVNATDPEGSALTVQFFNAATNALLGTGTLSGGSYVFNWTPPSEGVYQIRATASDGALSSSIELWAVSMARPNATPVIPGSKATSNIGAIASTFGVSDGGAATYSIPIAVPPGPNGMQPSLAISYSSQGGNGALGMGWDLSGASAITRCPATVATNGYKDGINYDESAANDVYCLDGQRLIPVVARQPVGATIYCGNSPDSKYRTEFRTEIESFSRIFAYEDEPCLLRGPTRFEVVTKGGQWMVFGIGGANATAYGDGDTGALVMSRGWAQPGRFNQAKIWPLSRVIDAAGNLMRYEYCGESLLTFSISQRPCDSDPIGPITNAVPPYAAFPPSEHHLKAIYYGGHANTGRVTDAPVTARVDFRYGLRWYEDLIRAFDSGGGESTLKYALYSITTSTSGQYAQTYILDYEIAPSRRYRLKEIKQCAPTASGGPGVCLNPTKFEYSAGAALQFQGGPIFSGGNPLDGSDAADLDGDGRTDLVYVSDGGGNGTQEIRVALSSEGFVWRGVSVAPWVVRPRAQRYLADFNGDGKADLILASGADFLFCDLRLPSPIGTPAVCTSSAGNFQGPTSDTDYFYLQGDFDGDGRIDIMVPRVDVNGPAVTVTKWRLHLGGPFGPAGNAEVDLPWAKVDVHLLNERYTVGDFNGDGRADILVVSTGASCGSGGGIQQTNGCGAADLKVTICFSRPAGPTGGVVFDCGSPPQLRPGVVLPKSVTMDFNGDGLADLAYPKYDQAGILEENLWTFCLSSGEGTFSKADLAAPENPPVSLCKNITLFELPSGARLPSNHPKDKIVFGDFDGDGRSDLATHVANGTWRICLARGGDISSNANPLTFACQDWIGGFDPLGDEANDVLAGDFNGDGKTDLLRINHGGDQPYPNSPAVKVSAGTAPDLLVSVQNGLGATTQIDYLPITDANVYTRGGASALPGSGEVLVQSPLYVVKKTYEDNGIGGTFDHTYSYTGLKGSTNGRGLLGFETRTVVDGNGLTRTTTYNQSLAQWWMAGRPARVITRSGGTVLSDIRTDWQMIPAQPGVYQVHLARTLEAKNDLFGTNMPCSRTTMYNAGAGETSISSSSVDPYGNSLVVYTDVGSSCDIASGTFNAAGFKKTTVNSYVYDAGAWILGRLTSATVTHEAPSVPSITRTSSFAYHGLAGASCPGAPAGYLCRETIEPNGGNDRVDTTYEYDSRGNTTRSAKSYFDPVDNAIRQRDSFVAYDLSGRFPTRSTNAMGHVEDRTYDARFGAVKTVTRYFGDPVAESQRFLRTTNVIDDFGRKVGESVRGGDGSLLSEADVTWASSPFTPTLTTAYAVTTVSNTGAASTTYFDRFQRQVATSTKAFASGEYSTTTTTYDTKGRKATFERPAGGGTVTSQYSYDVLDRPTTETTIGAGFTTTATSSYYGLFSVVRRTNSTGIDHKVVTERDIQGRVKTVTDCVATGPNTTSDLPDCLGRTPIATTMGYDATGNVTKVTSPGGIERTTVYDILGRRRSSSDPDIGNWTYTYDGLGQLATQTHQQAAGVSIVVTTQRDILGRDTHRVTKRGNTLELDAVTFYDGDSSIAPRVNGAVFFRLSSDKGIVSFEKPSYDDYGRLYRRAVGFYDYVVPEVEANSFTLFDAQGRVSQTVFPSGQGLVYGYSTWNGQATTVSDLRAPGTLHWSAVERYKDGQIKKMTVGGATVDETYDGLGRPATISAQSGAFQNGVYTYDALGNLKSRSDSANGIASQAFDYDSLNRVTAGSGATYDNAGNIASLNGGHSYVPGTNRVQTTPGATYAYDLVGNLTSGNGRTITWKAFNMPETVTKGAQSLTWSYGGDQQRIREISATGGSTTMDTLYFPGGELITTGSNKRWRHYISTPEGSVGSIDVVLTGTPAVERRYWLRDHLGSVVASIDAGTGQRSSFGFTVWGDRTSPVTPSATSVQRGFTGHEMLDEVGLVHMNGRLYDPAIGKFISADPIVQDPLSGQSWNRYSYVMNNPLSATDPSGYASTWVQWRRPISAIAVAALTYNAVYAMQVAGFVGPLSAAEISVVQGYSAVAAGFAAGGVAGGNVQSAFQGAFFAGINFGIGQWFAGIEDVTLAHQAMHVGMHALAGCAQQRSAGGKCGAGAAAAGFSALAGHAVGGAANTLLGRIAIGAVASRLGGDKAQNGAITAAFEYLFNCLPHDCPGNYDKKDPSYHQYMYEPEWTCNASRPYCLESLSYALHQYNGPGQSRAINVGETAIVRLTGSNDIRIESMGPYVVTNTTEPNHMLRQGVVVRWVGVDANGRAGIWAYGEGVNTNRAWASANMVIFGPMAFKGIVPAKNMLHSFIFHVGCIAGSCP